MSFEQRNKIHLISEENEEGIYASFPCDYDDEHDYLLLSDISKVSIMPCYVNMFDPVTCKTRSEAVTFAFEYNKEVDSNNVYIYPEISGHRGESVSIELQTFADELVTSMYKDELFDRNATIKLLKDEALDYLKTSYFSESGIAAINDATKYTGKAINKNGETVMIINGFTIEEKSIGIQFKLNDCISYLPLKELETPALVFDTGKVKFIINDYTLNSSIEGMVKNYEITVKNVGIEQSSDGVIIPYATSITDLDLYFDERAAFLSGKDKVFKDVSSTDSMSDLFDFDF